MPKGNHIVSIETYFVWNLNVLYLQHKHSGHPFPGESSIAHLRSDSPTEVAEKSIT